MYWDILCSLMEFNGQIVLIKEGRHKKAVAMCVVTLPEEDYLDPREIVKTLSGLYAEAWIAVEIAGVAKYCDDCIREEFISAIVDKFIEFVLAYGWCAIPIHEATINLHAAVPTAVSTEELYA